MEILVNTVPKITMEHPAPGTNVTQVTLTKNGLPMNSPVLTPGTNSTSATLPYQDKEGMIKAVWNFSISGSGTYKREEHYEVVTPYLELKELRTIVDDDDFDDADLLNLEAAVRHAINAHTGQSFGKQQEARYVYGNNKQSLELPARLISVTAFNGVNGLPASMRVTGDGWYLSSTHFHVPSIRADDNGINIAEVPIRAPSLRGVYFRQDIRFKIDGIWGWEYIPSPVKEAARILANDYSGDSTYRDRYLVSMTAADWRIQFTNGAFMKTGNVRADQLLSGYVLKRGWAVL